MCGTHGFNLSRYGSIGSNMELNPAAKVGIVTVVAVLLFLLSISQIGRFGRQDGDEYRILFDSVGALQERSPVYLAGVPIGYVKNLELSENNKVQATIKLTREDVDLYRAREASDQDGTYYVYTITGNLLGDRWICLLYTSPSPRDQRGSRMPSSA